MITCTFENGGQASPGLRHVTLSVIVIKDQDVLMVLRQAVPGLDMLETGKWALPGGFFDRDENIEQAARREVLEETGWELGDLQLFRIVSRPDRPHEDRQNMDMVFTARATRQVGMHDNEVAKLKWFPLKSVPLLEQIAFDHGEDLTLYQQHLRNPLTLPVIT